jgi:hypothetical protein
LGALLLTGTGSIVGVAAGGVPGSQGTFDTGRAVASTRTARPTITVARAHVRASPPTRTVDGSIEAIHGAKITAYTGRNVVFITSTATAVASVNGRATLGTLKRNQLVGITYVTIDGVRKVSAILLLPIGRQTGRIRTASGVGVVSALDTQSGRFTIEVGNAFAVFTTASTDASDGPVFINGVPSPITSLQVGDTVSFAFFVDDVTPVAGNIQVLSQPDT